MTCPTSIRVLGLNIPVERSNSDQEWGSYSGHTGRISLSSVGNPDMQAGTLLHEIVHVLEVELAIKLGEARVTQLATGLFQVLRDNPEMVSFLCGGVPHEQTIVEIDRTPDWITHAKIEQMWTTPDGGGKPVLVSYIRLPESAGQRPVGGDEVVASSERADGGCGANVPESSERLRGGEASCTE